MEDVKKVRSRELSGRVDQERSTLLESERRKQHTEGLLHTGSLEPAHYIATILGSIMPQLREVLEEYREELVLVRERLRIEGRELVLVWKRENGKSEIKLF
ncbi:MAG: hypothetical protein OXD43_11860 [Bacteroidetes bacterium]|nr:hypothetical protein [Bacteroidota bacterium]